MAADPRQPLARSLLSRILADLQGRAGGRAFSDERLEDVVTRFGLDKFNAEENDEYETAVSEMIRVLTHIPSNPSQASLARLVMKSYQFTGNEASGQVNASPQSAARYVAHLVAMAKSNRPRTADGESVALRAPAVRLQERRAEQVARSIRSAEPRRRNISPSTCVIPPSVMRAATSSRRISRTS